MLYLSAGSPPRNNRQQIYSSAFSPQAQALRLRVETRSASGPIIPFCPPIPNLEFEQPTNYFMDVTLPTASDGDISQPFSADAAVATQGNLFRNSISIDTDISFNSRRRKRVSPVTPMSHAHQLSTELFSSQFSQSFAASQENPDHSHVPSSSISQPGLFDAFGPLPAELGLSPTLARSNQPQRSRSTSQNIQPPSQVQSSRNPSPRLSTSSAPAKTNSHQGAETTEYPPKKKRRRQALSCTECKRRKIRCDRVQPCTPCKKRGEGDKCRWHILEPVCVKFLPICVDCSDTGALSPLPSSPRLPR